MSESCDVRHKGQLPRGECCKLSLEFCYHGILGRYFFNIGDGLVTVHPPDLFRPLLDARHLGPGLLQLRVIALDVHS